MYSNFKRSLLSDLRFSFPKLHSGKSTYVDFYFYDDGKKHRFRYSLNHCKTKAELSIVSNRLIYNLYNKLLQGWNPLITSCEVANTSESSIMLHQLISKYRDYISIKHPITESRKTHLSYISHLNLFASWLNSYNKKSLSVDDLTTPLINDYLDYCFYDKRCSARTRNNYRMYLHMFCDWLVEHGNLKDNPVSKTKKFRESEKIREAMNNRQLELIKDYLYTTNKHYYLACMLEYYTFIRPIELVQIRLSDININNQSIFIDKSISKNNRDGYVGLNASIIKLMLDLNVFDYPNNYFLFGRNFRPSLKSTDSRIFREYWAKVRVSLRLPNNIHFYSFKDSGIRDLANSEGIVIARDQARHTDIETTNKYLKSNGKLVHPETKNFDGAL